MKTIRGFFVVAAAWVVATAAGAGEIVLVPSTIPYQKDDTANENIRRECTWNTTMPVYLAKESGGRVKVAEQSLDKVMDTRLVLVATHLHAIGGGGWTGPKWLVLEGKLMEGDKLLVILRRDVKPYADRCAVAAHSNRLVRTSQTTFWSGSKPRV